MPTTNILTPDERLARKRRWRMPGIDASECDATPEQDAEQAAYEAECERLESAAGVYLATSEDWLEYAAWSARNWG